MPALSAAWVQRFRGRATQGCRSTWRQGHCQRNELTPHKAGSEDSARGHHGAPLPNPCLPCHPSPSGLPPTRAFQVTLRPVRRVGCSPMGPRAGPSGATGWRDTCVSSKEHLGGCMRHGRGRQEGYRSLGDDKDAAPHVAPASCAELFPVPPASCPEHSVCVGSRCPSPLGGERWRYPQFTGEEFEAQRTEPGRPENNPEGKQAPETGHGQWAG